MKRNMFTSDITFLPDSTASVCVAMGRSDVFRSEFLRQNINAIAISCEVNKGAGIRDLNRYIPVWFRKQQMLLEELLETDIMDLINW